MAVFAPMPSASVSTATAVKPGFFSSWRKANLRSFIFGFTIYDLRFTRWQISNSKLQAPEKSQAPNSNDGRPASVLELEIWSFFGAWILVFGVFMPGFGAWFLELSFVSQRLHRIDSRRAAGGQPAGEHGH